jgi:hypothetical protein
MRSRSRSTAACGVLLAGLFAGAPMAGAADVSYGANVGMGYTDNVTRVPDGELDETIASIGAQFRLAQESRRLNANIVTRLEYREYLDNSFDSEIVGNLIGSAVFDIVEERFTWTVDDTFGQTMLNQFLPSTPANRENANRLATGPDLTLPFGSRNKFILRGRYIDLSYEDSDLGNQRTRGEASLARDVSDVATASANVTTERVEFDDQARFANFDHSEAFLSYDVDSARTTLSIDGGITEIESEGETSDTWLGRLEFARKVSVATTVGIELGHDFSDAGDAFANLQALQPGSLEPVPVQQTATPFENTYGILFGRFTRNRTGMQLRLGYYDESYDDQPLFDRKRYTLDLALHRDISSVMSARLGANYSRQEYETVDQDFADLKASLGVRWNTGRSSYLSFEYQYLDRSDDAAGDYNASELWLRFAYQVGEDVSGESSGGY